MSTNEEKQRRKRIIALASAAVAGAITITSLSTSMKFLEEGNVGVITRNGGFVRIADTTGLNFVTPFVGKMTKFDVKVKSKSIEFSAASSDMQKVTGVATINYHLDKEKVEQVYKTIGANYESVLIDEVGIVEHNIKTHTVKYKADETLNNRDNIAEATKDSLNESLNSKGIIIESVKIPDLDFSEEYNKAIEEKQIVEQQTQTASRQKEKTQIETETKIIEANAEAEANAIISSSLTEQIIELEKIKNQLKAIDKWNGIMPNVTSGAVPFISTDDISSGFQKTK